MNFGATPVLFHSSRQPFNKVDMNLGLHPSHLQATAEARFRPKGLWDTSRDKRSQGWGFKEERTRGHHEGRREYRETREKERGGQGERRELANGQDGRFGDDITRSSFGNPSGRKGDGDAREIYNNNKHDKQNTALQDRHAGNMWNSNARPPNARPSNARPPNARPSNARPMDRMQDIPLDERQNRPFVGPHDRPLEGRNDRPLDGRHDRPLDGRHDRPFEGRTDRPANTQGLNSRGAGGDLRSDAAILESRCTSTSTVPRVVPRVVPGVVPGVVARSDQGWHQRNAGFDDILHTVEDGSDERFQGRYDRDGLDIGLPLTSHMEDNLHSTRNQHTTPLPRIPRNGPTNRIPGTNGPTNGIPRNEGPTNGIPGNNGHTNGIPRNEGPTNGIPGNEAMANGEPINNGAATSREGN